MITNPGQCRENGLQESIVKKCIAELDWDRLKIHLDNCSVCSADIATICGHIRRCTELVCKYPRLRFQQCRNDFHVELKTYIEENFGTAVSQRIDAEFALIHRIEKGYRSILDVLDKCLISGRSPSIRVAAIIGRACREYQIHTQRQEKALQAMTQMSSMSEPLIEDGDGNAYSGGALLDGLSETVASTLIMEAYKNSWFLEDLVLLPELPSVGEVERYQAGATQVLALYWRQWQRVEQRRRFLGGELRIRTEPDLPQGIPDSVQTLIEYMPSEQSCLEREVYDYIANRRLQDRLNQTFMEMETELGISVRGVGIGDGAALPPDQVISGEEGHACVSLSEILGYAIVDDEDRPGGLRLLEWVRGYAVLREMANSPTRETEASSDQYANLVTCEELVDVLGQCGLEAERAQRFITLASLRKQSRDMYDCPLVRVGSSSYLLFGPAAANLNIAPVVLSNLSSLNEELGRKGKAFEQSIRKGFKKLNMEVFSFRTVHDDKEYEFDAIVPWGNYLFVLECKNRNLSGGNPVQMYYFDKEIHSQVKQVQRLTSALASYPEIIKNNMGKQYLGMKIVPCVVHSLPYSRMGDVDGVYFIDASALRRFFEQRYFHVSVPHRVGASVILHRTALQKLWKGEEPDVDDFLKQLNEPYQLALSMSHLDVRPVESALSETEVVVAYGLIRKEVTIQSVCDFVGSDANTVLQEIAAISEHVDVMRTELHIDRD